MQIKILIHSLPRNGQAKRTIHYNGYTLGRNRNTSWAVWHHTGWIDTGEVSLRGAKQYVDYLNAERYSGDPSNASASDH